MAAVPLQDLSPRLANVRPSPTLAITARAKALQEEGHDVVGFGAGEPDFNTPQPVIEAAIQALHDGATKYTPSAGLPALRKAVSEKLLRENKLHYNPDQVVVSCGAKHSVYNALQVLLSPGDEVILLAPYWMTYRDQIILADGVPVVVHSTAKDHFAPSLDAIQEAITPRTRAIIINSPCNPTGAMIPRDVLEGIAELAVQKDFWIISDEIYEHLTYDEPPVSVAGFSKAVYDHVITITGCSKSYSMTGWRIGFMAAPKPIATAVSMLQDQVTSNPTSFAQYGAIAALHLPQHDVETMRLIFEGRRNLVMELLHEIPGVATCRPQGAFYAFPSVPLLEGETDADLAQTLLEECHVAVVPGSVFEGPGHIRLSYATGEDRIRVGLDRLKRFFAHRVV